MIRKSLPLAYLIVAVGFLALVSPWAAEHLMFLVEKSHEPELLAAFLSMSFICFFGFASFYLSRGLPLPSFVAALFVGIAAKPFLLPIVENHVALSIIVSLGAALILFQGGLETLFKNFRRLFPKIFLLAFPGVVITAMLLSYAIAGAGSITGITVPVTVAVLLGAILASTDPAAIVPLLQGLAFQKPEIKDIVVSESAMNDVVGALLTLALTGFALSMGAFVSIGEGYAALLSRESGALLFSELFFGVAAGIIGFLLLRYLERHKRKHGFEHGADAAFFIFVPMLAFATALIVGGSGYLAAFVAGLAFDLAPHLKATEHFYNQVIDGFAKPAIFLLLGALVDLPALIHYAPVGIVVALVFMFVIRPAMVFLMLGGFTFFGRERMSVRELLFISWVRETGAIPAVLLVTVAGLSLSGMEALVPVGMWVILATLVIQPPLTPWLARRLGVAE